jgi:hypothetical protein
MTPLAFVKSLLRITPKDRVAEDYRITMNELKERVIPAFRNAVTFFDTDKPRSKLYEELNKRFSISITQGKSMTILKTINEGLKAVVDNTESVYKQFDKETGADIAADSMTYSRASMLQLLEAASFVSNFSLIILNYIYVIETAEREKKDPMKEFLPAELEQMKKRFDDYTKAFRALTTPNSVLVKRINEIPNAIVNDDSVASMRVTMGDSKTDPFAMGLIGTKFNPFNLFGTLIAEMQAARYKMNKEKLSLFQMRKYNLEQIAKGAPDATVQREIQYLEDRIRKLEYQIAQAEEDYVK